MSTSTIDAVIGRVDALHQQQRHREALELLVEQVAQDADPDLLALLVTARHLAAVHTTPPAPPDFTPPTAVDAHEQLRPRPPADISVDALRHDLSRFGCMWIRPLIDSDQVEALRTGIDRSLDAFDQATSDNGGAADDGEGWYAQFTPDPGRYRVGGRRQWVRKSGALWTADSPRMLHELTQVITNTGIGQIVEEYFGERPALSANKCTLRRVPLDTNVGWHQDGAFLGPGIRSLNLWLALDHCGRTAPGMDIVPRRLDHIVETGTEGAIFDWSVSRDVAERQAGPVGIVRPEFEPGDALIFDHLFLHSTAVEPDMTQERHAMETWLFAPSAYPEGQIPLAW